LPKINYLNIYFYFEGEFPASRCRRKYSCIPAWPELSFPFGGLSQIYRFFFVAWCSLASIYQNIIGGWLTELAVTLPNAQKLRNFKPILIGILSARRGKADVLC